MIKVGEHITIDFLGVKKDYSPEFYEKVIYKIAKAAKVEILNVSQHKFKPQGFTLVALLAESHNIRQVSQVYSSPEIVPLFSTSCCKA